MNSHLLTTALLSSTLLLPLGRGSVSNDHDVLSGEVRAVATDFRFALPDTLSAGRTTFLLVNRGREPHHLLLVRLLGDKSASDLAAAMKAPGPFPSWAIPEGGPNAADPGSASLPTIVNLEAGHYAALCIIPGPDGIPHVMKGMIRDLVVRPSNQGVSAERAPDLTISLTDYAFRPTKPIVAGNHLVAVRNDGKQAHELQIAKLLPGKTPGDLAAWAEKMAGPPPAHFIGGVSPIAPGKSNELELNLTPGHYVLLCFVPDAADGKPHVAHGMVRDLIVQGSAKKAQ
jgi:uncharacterized cupredoxin-like copper-binding protein